MTSFTQSHVNYDPKKGKINPKCCQIFPNRSFAHLQQLQSLLGLCLLPAILVLFDVPLEELGLVGVGEDELALLDEVHHHVPLGVELLQGLLLPLDQLIHVLDAGGHGVPGRGEHDAVQELDVRLQLVSIGIEVDHDLGLGHSRDELLVLLDKVVQQVVYLVLGPLSH